MKHTAELSGSDRRVQILQILQEKREVSSAELADRFGVSVMTIRRDLHFFEDQGILEMHYGGARIRDAVTPFVSFSNRTGESRKEKISIARRAAAQVQEDDILFLDTSTTVLPLLDFVPDMRLTVVTTSLPALVALSGRPKIRAIACPGEYRDLYGGVMDYTTVAFLRNYHFQKAFLGAGSCDPDFGISCSEEVEAAVKRTVLERSDRAYLLVDYSKMNSHTFINISDLDVFDAVFTNAQLSQKIQAAYTDRGTKLVLC